ncbi:unnamed protein product [Ectocarpus sp. 12 AP-2014]
MTPLTHALTLTDFHVLSEAESELPWSQTNQATDKKHSNQYQKLKWMGSTPPTKRCLALSSRDSKNGIMEGKADRCTTFIYTLEQSRPPIICPSSIRCGTKNCAHPTHKSHLCLGAVRSTQKPHANRPTRLSGKNKLKNTFTCGNEITTIIRRRPPTTNETLLLVPQSPMRYGNDCCGKSTVRRTREDRHKETSTRCANNTQQHRPRLVKKIAQITPCLVCSRKDYRTRGVVQGPH